MSHLPESAASPKIQQLEDAEKAGVLKRSPASVSALALDDHERDVVGGAGALGEFC